MKTFLIRGVPQAMQRDGWWMNATASDDSAMPASKKQADGWQALILLALIALGDVLIWGVIPGVSLAVFGGAIVLAALWVAGSRLRAQQQALIAGGGVLVLLPLVELVQPLSIMIAVVGVSALLAVVAGLKPNEVVRGALRLWPLGVRQTVVDVARMAQPKGSTDLSGLLGRVVMAWFVPMLLGLVFVVLLLEANPIAARWVDQIWALDFHMPDGARLLFWICLLPVAWTALSLGRMRERLRAAPVVRPMGPQRKGLINPASVIRALVIFNAVFAVQTVMDVIYLYGGAGLPEGISYAEYAHRGAYPLVVTGLLAGGFAVMTRRWVEGSAVMRVLLMLWVAQNVALVISSIVRLELYVSSYGLTHLRMAAGIWMALTAAGLALILWQVWKSRDTMWLVLRGAALTAAVLYGCAWVSFDAVIARHNLASPAQLDHYHLCRLGDAAVPIIVAYSNSGDTKPTKAFPNNSALCQSIHLKVDSPRDWREWGFRNWRARTSLAAVNAEARP